MGGNESGADTLTTAEYWWQQRRAFYLLYGLCRIGLLIGGAALLHKSYPLATASIGVLFTGILGMGFLIGGAEHDYWEYVRRGKIKDPGADAQNPSSDRTTVRRRLTDSKKGQLQRVVAISKAAFVTPLLLDTSIVLGVQVVQQGNEISRVEHEIRWYEEHIDRKEAPAEDGVVYLFDVPSGCQGVLNVSRSARDKFVIEDGDVR